MGKVRNFLFIMCDQLRADYLSCTGHPTLETPHIDGLAQRGVLFERAYCQAPVCGPSRMSFYTGRYMFSHGATWNNVPLDVGERTLGDYLRPLGVRTALVGKTHMAADDAGLAQLGIDPDSERGILIRECGFEPYLRYDGLHPKAGPNQPYNDYLREKGYGGENPWHDYANSAAGPDGEILSGWHMRHARLPARVREEHSETAFTTDRALDFIGEAGDDPWCLHLSYIKPHWPYMAPAPYHDSYGPNQILPVRRHTVEQQNPHPVYRGFCLAEEAESFAREGARETVIPAYMGLIKQIDDHVGRVIAYLREQGRLDDTMIILTSDHGDYLGDHWLGEKELFHEQSVRIPMILVDPDGRADATRGTIDRRFVEAIDLVPTMVEAAGGEVASERLEGRSLLALTRGHEGEDWRDAVFAEADYSFRGVRLGLGLGASEARAFMIRTDDWKYIHYEGFRPQLFDLVGDPDEYHDLGDHQEYEEVRALLHERLFAWLRGRRTRKTISDKVVDARVGTAKERGFLIGVW